MDYSDMKLTGCIRIPVLRLVPHVLPKEDMSLDPLQQFLVDAVSMGGSAEDIAAATNLTLPTIKSYFNCSLIIHCEKRLQQT